MAQKKDGTTFPIGLSVSEVDHLNVFTGIIRDMSAVRELQRQVLEVAAEEQRRIGHELHDNIQQQLTGLGLLAQSLTELLRQHSPQQAERAARLASGLKQANEEVHLLSRGLVPVEVDAEGLRSALDELSSRVSQQYGIACEFQASGGVEISDNFKATHLYRIAQEAVTNAVKHGRSTRIDIELIDHTDGVCLTVRDNGVGIDKRVQSPGMGLRIMHYRAGLIGATLQVDPTARGGTLMSCTVLGRANLHE